MKIRTLVLTGLTVLCVTPMVAVASTPNQVSPEFGETSPTSITVVLNCEILDVKAEDGTILLRELRTGSEEMIAITDGIKLRARRKKDFGGRRNLALADLTAGQQVRVMVNRESGAITQISVVKLKAA